MPQLEVLSGRERLRASIAGWLPWVGKGSFALLDQGLFAGANFIVNILLARWLTPGEYGAFAVAFSVFLLLGVFHTAIFTEPMMVFGPGKYREGLPEYFGILLRGHFALMLPGAALLTAVAFLLGRFYSPAVERAFFGVALGPPSFSSCGWCVEPSTCGCSRAGQQQEEGSTCSSSPPASTPCEPWVMFHRSRGLWRWAWEASLSVCSC